MKPPMCAHHATPPDVSVVIPRLPTPLTSCWINHMPRKAIADNSKVIKKNSRRTLILDFGNITRYAPITAEIAPEAPNDGISDPRLKKTCVNVAMTPPRI